MSKPGRNDPCPCGSGKKYKQCCWKNTFPTKKKLSASVLSGKANLAQSTFGKIMAPPSQEDENSTEENEKS